jgi:hypothetical protein
VLQSVVSAVMETPGLDLYAVPIALSFDRIVVCAARLALAPPVMTFDVLVLAAL